MKYTKSKYLQVIKGDEKYFVYHSLFNNPLILDKSIIDFIDLFKEPKTIDEIRLIVEGDVNEIVTTLSNSYFLVNSGFDEKSFLNEKQAEFIKNVSKGNELTRLELAISNSCNFGCKHCMHFLNNNYQNNSFEKMNMSIETAKNSIDTFVNKVRENGNNRIRIHFGNGEPLINWKTILFTLEYCKTIDDMVFSFAVNTNLSLLTKEIALKLKEYNVKISTSIDGLEKANNLIRTYRNGKGTFNVIIEKINLLKEIDFPIDGFSITVTDKNYPYIDNAIIDFGKKIGVKDISMDFDLVDTTQIPIEDCVSKIISMRKYANSIGLNFYGTWETPFRILTNNSWLESPHAFCPAFEGKTIEFNVDSTIKVCGHTNTIIGHRDTINQMFHSESKYTQLIKERMPGNNEFCIDCEIEGSCAGQCHVTVEASRQNTKLIENMCELMKLTTRALIKEYLNEYQ